MSLVIRRDVLLWGERGRTEDGGIPSRTVVSGPDLSDGRRGWVVVLFRVGHTDGDRKTFERQCDKRGVEFRRVKAENESMYEVWGPTESLRRLSRESVVIGRDGSHPCLFATDTPAAGVCRPAQVGDR